MNDFAGHPFQVELSRELSRRGHRVTHAYCRTNRTPHGDLSEGVDGPRVVALSTGGTFEKYRPGKRVLHELVYGWRSAALTWRERPDVMLTSNVPVLSLVPLWVVSRVLGIRWVLWLQDVQGGLAAAGGPFRGRMLGRMLGRAERRMIRVADHVVVIADDFTGLVVAAGRDASSVSVIENWAPVERLDVRDRRNPWSARQGLGDQLVFLYSGTLGRKHPPELLVELARHVGGPRLGGGSAGAEVVVVGEGPGASWLSREASRQGLGNLRVLPFQPFADLPDVLASADVLVVVLAESAGTFSVPSKVLSYLCAERPVLAALPAANAAASLVTGRARAGLVTTHDREAFLHAAQTLAEDADLRRELGRRGRAYAEANFPIGAIADRFEAVLIHGRDVGRRPGEGSRGTRPQGGGGPARRRTRDRALG